MHEKPNRWRRRCWSAQVKMSLILELLSHRRETELGAPEKRRLNPLLTKMSASRTSS